MIRFTLKKCTCEITREEAYIILDERNGTLGLIKNESDIDTLLNAVFNAGYAHGMSLNRIQIREVPMSEFKGLKK